MIYPSSYWKRQAREALRNHWLTALLIALVVNLPSLLVQGIASVTGNDLLTRVQETIYASLSESGTAIDMNRLASGMEAVQGSTGIWVMQGLNVLAWLLTPCLTLGMVAWLLSRLRKQEDGGWTDVFSRAGLFFKGIGLRLYIAWRIFLFMLPGLALCVLSLLPVWLSDTSSSISALSAVNTSVGLMYAAMAATAVLSVIAALKYALGDMFLADHPEMGPVQAAKASKQMTRGRKGQVFALYVSFIFWYLLEMLVSSLCFEMFGSIPSLMVQMLASLAITVYLNASLSAYYLGHQAQKEPGEEAEPENPAEGGAE